MPGPLPISPETAIKLSKYLGVPIEHLVHMPRHILLQKLAEMAAKEQARSPSQDPKPVNGKTDEPAGGPSAGPKSGPSDNPGKDERS
jgi:hypothetical protein